MLTDKYYKTRNVRRTGLSRPKEMYDLFLPRRLGMDVLNSWVTSLLTGWPSTGLFSPGAVSIVFLEPASLVDL